MRRYMDYQVTLASKKTTEDRLTTHRRNAIRESFFPSSHERLLTKLRPIRIFEGFPVRLSGRHGVIGNLAFTWAALQLAVSVT